MLRCRICGESYQYVPLVRYWGMCPPCIRLEEYKAFVRMQEWKESLRW